METIRKIRLALSKGMSIREASKKFCKSRNTIRKIQREGATSFTYRRTERHYPALGDYIEALEALLAANEELAASKRRTMLSLYEELQGQGRCRDVLAPHHLRLRDKDQQACQGSPRPDRRKRLHVALSF